MVAARCGLGLTSPPAHCHTQRRSCSAGTLARQQSRPVPLPTLFTEREVDGRELVERTDRDVDGRELVERADRVELGRELPRLPTEARLLGGRRSAPPATLTTPSVVAAYAALVRGSRVLVAETCSTEQGYVMPITRSQVTADQKLRSQPGFFTLQFNMWQS